jgi:hypothetical protein
MAHSTNLTTLRRRRLYIHRQLDRYEPFVERLRENLADCNAAIQAIRPELPLPPRRYQPNPYFARGELPRLALAIMREAGEPLGVREIAVRALASKGITLPDRRAMKLTRLRLHQAFIRFRERGILRTIGSGNAGKQELGGWRTGAGASGR